MAKTSAGLRALLASARIAVEDITVYARSNLEHGFVHRPPVVQVQVSVAAGIFGRGNDAIPRRFSFRGILEQQCSGMRNPEVRSAFAAYSTLMRPGGRGRGGGIAEKRVGVGGRGGEQRMGADQSRDRSSAFGGAARKGGNMGFLRRKEERSSTSSKSATSSKGFLRRKEEERSSSSSRSATSSKQEWAGKRKSRQLDSQGRVRKSVKPRSFERLQNRSRTYDEEDSEERRPKRRRHIMRLHRNDQTNKRIVEDSSPVTSPAKFVVASKGAAKPKEEEKIVTVPSQNALFRAIQPLPEILRHIESHLLGMRRLWEWRKGGYHTKLKAPLDDVPHGSRDGRLPIQETVFKRKLEFIAAAKASSSLPSQALPEIAFAGRSNVGKSSLINALTRQWGVVRTSDKPGLTQSINFFTLGARLCLVDLPGYGFAYAKEETKEAWEDLMSFMVAALGHSVEWPLNLQTLAYLVARMEDGAVKEYVTTRKGLKRVCLLVDAKWGLKPRDDELIYLMENSSTKYQVVLTKTDVLSPIDLARRATQIQETLKHNNYAVLPVVMVSSQTGGGIPHLRKVLANLTVPL